jgi:hypothetical protein
MPVLRLPGRWWTLHAGLILSTLLLLAARSPLQAETAVSKEYQIKAVFLFNFAQFVQWPPKAFASANEPFRIGVLGDDPFDAFLDETVNGEKIASHPLGIERYRSAEDIKDCQILFISRSENGRMGSILDGLKGRNVLTIGDTDGFIESGGIIRFITVNNKIHFRINLEAAKRANLTISSQVLRLAEITGPGKE